MTVSVSRIAFFVISIAVGGLSICAMGEESVKIKQLNFRAPQVSEESKAQYLCYQLAKAGTDAGEVTGDKSLGFLPGGINGNQAPIYQITKYSAGLTCYVLKNAGANDFSWGLGGARLDGCTCSGDLEIVK